MNRRQSVQQGIDNKNGWIHSFFTIARFGPDSFFIFFLLGFSIVVLYFAKLDYLATLVLITLAIIFFVESAENIQLQRPTEFSIIGTSCLIVKEISKGKRGIVKVYREGTILTPELWTAESDYLLEEGKGATVIGIKSIILQVQPNERPISS